MLALRFIEREDKQCHGSYVTEREKDDSFWDSNHTPSDIRADFLSRARRVNSDPGPKFSFYRVRVQKMLDPTGSRPRTVLREERIFLYICGKKSVPI